MLKYQTRGEMAGCLLSGHGVVLLCGIFQTSDFYCWFPSSSSPPPLHLTLSASCLSAWAAFTAPRLFFHTADGHSVTPLKAHTCTRMHTHTHTRTRHCSLCQWQWFRVLFTHFALRREQKCLSSSRAQLAEDLSAQSGTDLMLCVLDACGINNRQTSRDEGKVFLVGIHFFIKHHHQVNILICTVIWFMTKFLQHYTQL